MSASKRQGGGRHQGVGDERGGTAPSLGGGGRPSSAGARDRPRRRRESQWRGSARPSGGGPGDKGLARWTNEGCREQRSAWPHAGPWRPGHPSEVLESGKSEDHCVPRSRTPPYGSGGGGVGSTGGSRRGSAVWVAARSSGHPRCGSCTPPVPPRISTWLRGRITAKGCDVWRADATPMAGCLSNSRPLRLPAFLCPSARAAFVGSGNGLGAG